MPSAGSAAAGSGGNCAASWYCSCLPHTPRRRFRSSRAVAAASRARARWRCASCSTACSRASCRRLQLPTLAMRRASSVPASAASTMRSCVAATCSAATARSHARRVSAASVTTSCAACRVAICRRSAWRSVRQGRVMRSSRLNASVRSISRSWLLAKRPSVKCGLGRVMACTRSASATPSAASRACRPGLLSSAMRTAASCVRGSASQRWMESCACALAAASAAGKAACTPAVRPAVSWATSPRRPSGDTLAQPTSARAAPSRDKRCSAVMACLRAGGGPGARGASAWAHGRPCRLPQQGQEAAGAGRALRVESRRGLPRRGCRRAHAGIRPPHRGLGASWARVLQGWARAVRYGSAGWWGPAGRQRSAPFGPGPRAV